jgi:adenylosuccinate synthase
LDNYAAVARLARVISGHDIARVIAGRERIILEGAQGGLLDETFGFHPYTTWSSTNFSNAERLLDESEFAGRRTRMGILRSYFTRHGAGPLVSEDRSLHIPEPHNNNDGWQGDFRVGPLDTVAARYAIGAAGGIDALAITHLDALSQLPPHVCTHYRADGEINADWFTNQGDLITDIRRRPFADLNVREQLTRCLKKCAPVFSGISREPNVFVAAIRRMLHAPPLAITSWGPTAHEKRIHDPRL